AAPLIQALASPARMSRAAAILADLGAAQAIKPLAAYARHPDPNARRAALSALGRLGSQVHFKPIQAWYEAALDPEEQARAFAALIGTGHPGALDALLEALGGGDAQRRDLALTGLARFKGVTARISRQLRAEGLKARVAATLALAVVDVEEVEARLRAALAAPSVELRAAAIIALAHRRLNYAEISRGWADEHAEIRAATAYALGRFKAEADLETLETLTGDVSMRVRAAAAAAMSAYGARAASKLRRLALSGPDGATALAAAQGHLRGATGAELGQRAAVLLGSHHEEVQALAGRTISRGDEAQARLLATVLGDDPRAQAAATPLLVKLGPEITPGVLARFKGATADQQIALLRVLKGLGDPSVAPFIADLFEQAPPATVRREIVTLLGDCHDRALASATLKEALLDADLSVQIAAITALGQIRDKSAAPELIVMLSTAPKQAHRAIVRALGQIRQRDAISTLASHYRTRKHDVNASELRADLIVAIGQIGGRSSLPVLFDAMDDMDARVRQAAARALE
ncbi:HEAT repeat domain-containing protein, partial [Myxococcota bacterium]|nr:HEAT repeat domain-containing protein [Myxococcota bacterium]